MRKSPIVLVSVLVLAGCAGTQSQLRLLEKDGALRVEPSQSPKYDFLVTIRNVKDVGFNPDIKADRDHTALLATSAECREARVIGETVVNTGTYLLGDPSRTYSLQVKCVP